MYTGYHWIRLYDFVVLKTRVESVVLTRVESVWTSSSEGLRSFCCQEFTQLVERTLQAIA